MADSQPKIFNRNITYITVNKNDHNGPLKENNICFTRNKQLFFIKVLNLRAGSYLSNN